MEGFFLRDFASGDLIDPPTGDVALSHIFPSLDPKE